MIFFLVPIFTTATITLTKIEPIERELLQGAWIINGVNLRHAFPGLLHLQQLWILKLVIL